MNEEPAGDYCFLPAATLQGALEGARRVLLTAHVDPDPDGLGCVLGLSHLLRREGWATVPVCIGHLPSFAASLPGVHDVVVFPSRVGDHALRPVMSPGDALIVLDTPTAGRMAAFYETHRKTLAHACIVNIDHHFSNEGFGTFNLVDPGAAATAEVVMDVVDASGLELDESSATCLMTALVADTQCFRTESTAPRTLLLAHRLWQAGAPIYPIARNVFGGRPLSGLRLWGAALDRVGASDGVVWTTVTEGMLEEAGATMEEVEGLVDFLLSSRDAMAAVVFKEQDSETKVSVRTIPGVDAIRICSVFGGGGHQRAAGCSIFTDPYEAARQFLPVALSEARGGERRA